MDEFRHAMRQALGKHLSDHELDLLFMKVDTNCDGTVDWDEYLSYMLLEYKEKDLMNAFTSDKPLPKEMVKTASQYQRFHDTIVAILHIPNNVKLDNSLFKVLDDRGGRYASVSKEGVINFWNMDMKNVRQVNIKPTQKHASIWVTATVFMANVNLFAISTTSSRICMYDNSANVFHKRVTVGDLDVSALCMDYWYDDLDPSKSLLLWGDGRRTVTILVFAGCPQMCSLHPTTFKHHSIQVPQQVAGTIMMPFIIKGFYCGVQGFVLANIHQDFVKEVEFIPELGSFISCSRDSNSSMYLGDIESKRLGAVFKVRKGINSFSYCSKNNVLITGGYDAIVRVWNPYVPCTPVMLLTGHKSPVTFVIVNSIREQIISISEEKDIFIFDMSTQTCVQTLYRQWVPLGKRPIASAYFNEKRQALLLATNQVAVFEHKDTEVQLQQMQSHIEPVNIVLYNKLFQVAVSASTDSIVAVWDAVTGERTMQFVAHKDIVNGEEVRIEITAMAFDQTLRRLMTGARDGAVRIWNFNNGACLRELTKSESEITGIVCFRNRIVTAGWDKTIRVFMDNPDDDTVRSWKEAHKDDILTLAYYLPSLVASASYGGEILIWSIETGRSLAKLNIKDSTLPQTVYYGADLSMLKQAEKTIEQSSTGSKQNNSDSDHNIPETTKQTRRESVKAAIFRQMKFNRARKQSQGMFNLMTHSNITKRNTDSVDKLIFLQKRHSDKSTAILFASGAEGWVRAWSVHHQGGLLGQFCAAHNQGESVIALTTDSKNKYLITGDTSGYIKVWLISSFCISKKQMPRASSMKRRKMEKQFLLLRREAHIAHAKRQRAKLLSTCRYAKNLVKYPEILNSFRGHIQAITCVDFVDQSQQIITASSDCSVRLWTIGGQYIGIFGKDVPWKQPSAPPKTSFLPPITGRKTTPRVTMIPSDVRREASATTLQVLNGGVCPRWNYARNIILVWVPKKPKSDESRMVEPPSPKPEETAAAEERESDEETLKPKILGKCYKQTRKHQILPQLQKPRHFNNQVGMLIDSTDFSECGLV